MPDSIQAAVDADCTEALHPEDIAYIDYGTYWSDGGYRILQEIAEGTRPLDSVIQSLSDARLRELGGAGFPTGRKWDIVRNQSEPRYVAVNIDESEPGTFKDRHFLESDPHRFLEGALIAAKTVGAKAIYLYLWDEYPEAHRILHRELERLQADPPCALPPIHLRRGAGAYICGEESAMIESIEGKRGMPRLHPPFAAQVGLWGRPTVENNLKTLHWVRDILERGADWFTGFGRHGRTGLRAFAISGRVQQPGTNIASAGITLRELVDEYAGGMSSGVEEVTDTDVALLNGLMQAVIEQGLVDEPFVAERTNNFEALKENLKAYTPEAVAPVIGIDANLTREVAHVYAGAKRAMIFWGMGISQHIHGTDNSRALISLALISGQVGRRGTGLHPLCGQNNVQGASDVGLIPMVYPDYQKVTDPKVRAWYEAFWNAELDPNAGLTAVEITSAAAAGEIRGMYIMGENPAMSEPELAHARSGIASLKHLVVQDLFLTETACLADIVLPASSAPEKTGTFVNTDRRVQLGRQALDLPEGVRQDLDLIQALARRLGLDWNYRNPAEVQGEFRQAMPSITGISWDRLEREDSVTYPCPDPCHPGQGVMFAESFPTADGRAQLIPVRFRQGHYLPDQEYPFVLITGRQLEHWHTGAMSRRASTLDALEPDPVAMLHPGEMERLGLAPGKRVIIRSRQGQVTPFVRPDDGLQPKQVFLPFGYREAAANLLTDEAIDPHGKIPEFKFCAVQVTAVEEVQSTVGSSAEVG